MQPELKGVWKHMLGLGKGALAHALLHSSCGSMENRYWPQLAVLQAAHAAELLIKARIAEQHPLLVFTKLPARKERTVLGFGDLFETGKTLDFSELPDRLWATTGYHIPELERFKAFGKLRNTIQHFAPANSQDPSNDTLKFIFAVLDPMLYDWWKIFAIDCNEDHEPHIYLMEALFRREILFLVSPKAAKAWGDCSNFEETSAAYQAEMNSRLATARAK